MPRAKKPAEIEHWPLDRFIDYIRNPRKNDHAVDQTAAAIYEFGFRVPVLAKSDGLVVDGHLRLKAAKKLGLETVPVMLVDDMTEGQIKAFRISVNKVADLADWNYELLSAELDDLKGFDFDLSLTGFSDGELSNLLNADWEPPGQEPLETDEDSEDPDEEQERGHNIHLDAAQSAIWQQAVARLRESVPDLDEGQALVLLAEEYLSHDHDQAGAQA